MTPKALLCNEPLHPKKTGGKAESVFLFVFSFFCFFFFLGGGQVGVDREEPSCLLADPEPSTQKDADRVLVILQPQSSPGLTLLCVFRQFESPLCFFLIVCKGDCQNQTTFGACYPKEQRNNLKPLSQ